MARRTLSVGDESSEKTSDLGLKSLTSCHISWSHRAALAQSWGDTQSVDAWGCLGGHACRGRPTSL